MGPHLNYFQLWKIQPGHISGKLKSATLAVHKRPIIPMPRSFMFGPASSVQMAGAPRKGAMRQVPNTQGGI